MEEYGMVPNTGCSAPELREGLERGNDRLRQNFGRLNGQSILEIGRMAPYCVSLLSQQEFVHAPSER